MARSITSPELVYLRSPGQHSRLYLAVPATPVVFAARINQAFTKRDIVTSLTYDTVTTGAYTDIIPGMTVLIGSTAGASDVGIVRARKAASSTKVFIGETSDAWFDDNQYITVIRDFAPWPRHPRVTTSVVKMDYDIAYSDQNTDFSPIPVWGSDRVLGLTGVDGALDFDASGSWCQDSSISTYAWVCAGATIDDDTSATPQITFDTPGTYQVYLTITAANGKSTLSSRSVVIYRMFDLLDEDDEIIQAASPLPSAVLNECGGSLDSGGWSFGVTLLGSCDVSTIRPRAKIILVAEDYYNDSALSMGPLAGSENIVAIGWIAEEGMEIAPDASAATFTVKGANHWLNLESSFPLGIENTSATASAWTNIKGLTVDKMLVNTLIWRTTLPTILDCTLTGSTRKASELTAQAGTIWQQIVSIAQPTILAKPACDRYSRLYVEVYTQYMTSKASVPVVMTITKPDRAETLNFDRRVTPVTAQLRLSGIYYNGSSAKALFSLSPGHTPKQYGAWRNQDYLLLTSSQADANALAGDMAGTDNNQYPSIPIEFAQNNRFIDIVPHQFCYIDLPAVENVRGVGYTGNLIPKAVEYRQEEGFLYASVEFEAQCVREMAIKGDIPVSDSTSVSPPEAPPPVVIPPIIIPPEPPVVEDPPVISRINRVIVRDYNQGIYYTDTFSDASPLWLVANYGLPVAPTYISEMYPTGGKNLVVSYGYLYEDESTYPYSGVWGATPGGTFQKILSYADVASAIDCTSGVIRVWIAVSPFDDTIAALCQSTNKFEGTRKIFIGTSAGGFVAGVEIPHMVEVVWPLTTFGFGDGQWRLVTHGLIDDYTTVVRISVDGGTITHDDYSTIVNLGYTTTMQAFNTGLDFVLLPAGQRTTDNGNTFSAIASAPTTPGDWRQALAVDATSTVQMWASAHPLSTDSGANWGDFPSFPGDPTYGSRFFFYPPSIQGLNEWLATVPNAGFPTAWVLNSVDNGANWIDRTGDLLTVAEATVLTLVEIYGI